MIVTPVFNPEITFGAILIVVSIIAGWGTFSLSLRSKIELLAQSLSSIDKRLVAVEASIQNLSVATVQIAKQEVRLDSFAERIRALETIKTELLKK